MALLPSVAGRGKGKGKGKENIHPVTEWNNDYDDFKPLKKRTKMNQEDIKAMFPKSSISHCTFNINFKSD